MKRSYSARQRVLVTGGAGFLGSHLIGVLLERGDEVLCVDNLFTGTRDNLLPYRDHPRFEFLRHDITWPLYVEVDQIYNLGPLSGLFRRRSHYQHESVRFWAEEQHTNTERHDPRQRPVLGRGRINGVFNMLGLATSGLLLGAAVGFPGPLPAASRGFVTAHQPLSPADRRLLVGTVHKRGIQGPGALQPRPSAAAPRGPAYRPPARSQAVLPN
jgi:NAD(P)-dependent dehydrogenase (short-subunit alcohol dehydrogenase family)